MYKCVTKTVLLLLLSLNLYAQPAIVFDPDSIAVTHLLNENGGKTRIYPDHGDKLSLFIFLSPECPLCRNYTKTLNALNDLYGDQLNMIGIISGRSYKPKQIRAFRKEYRVSFPVFIDPKKQLTGYMDATVTPEVVLTDHNGSLIYRGAIDDWVSMLGKKRTKPEKHYLQDAISNQLKNRPVLISFIEPVGCRINDL